LAAFFIGFFFFAATFFFFAALAIVFPSILSLRPNQFEQMHDGQLLVFC
jgi:hypothetical protein